MYIEIISPKKKRKNVDKNIDKRFWLQGHYKAIGEVVGLDLVKDKHKPNLFHGSYKPNLKAESIDTSYQVYIEVCFDHSDYSGLIKFLTNPLPLIPNFMVWVCYELKKEERSMLGALNNLNNMMTDGVNFIGIELKMIRDGKHSTPHFTPVILPPNWDESLKISNQ